MTVLHCNASAVLRVTDNDTGETHSFPVISAKLNWAVNEIPTCDIAVGIGQSLNREYSDEERESAIKVMTGRRICRLYVEISGDYSPDDEWPGGEQLVFEGNCIGAVFALTRGRAEINVTLQHWLRHLQYSTILGGYAVPGDPDAGGILSAAFGFDISGAGSYAGKPPLATIAQLAHARSVFDSEFYSDLWGEGIKPLVDHLISTPLSSFGNTQNCESVLNQPSEEAVEAWRRIEGPSEQGTEYSPYAVPLSLTSLTNPGERLSQPVLEAISQSISHAPIDYARQTDIWSHLVGRYCTDFGLMVVPRVDSAIVAPRVDSLRTTYCRTLEANTIYQIDAFEPRQLPLAYVGVIADYESLTGSESYLTPNSSAIYGRFVGCYPHEVQVDDPQRLRTTNGLTQFTSRPAWLANVPVVMGNPSTRFVARLVNGGVGASQDVDDEGDARRKAAAETGEQVDDLLRRYAHMKYNQAILYGRNLKVVGKLRFDISPGSTVQVNVTPTELRGLSVDEPKLYGMVTRITIALDTRNRLATTVFQLSNIRNEDENQSDDFSSFFHPLYSTVFHGAPLLDAYAIGENADCPVEASEEDEADAADPPGDSIVVQG